MGGKLRYEHPRLGTFEGSPKEIAEAIATLREQGILHTEAHAQRVVQVHETRDAARVAVPTNERLIADYRASGGASDQTRRDYTRVADDFRHQVEPKSLLDVTTSDVFAYERRVSQACALMLTRGTKGDAGALPLRKCRAGVYEWTTQPPPGCSMKCPSWTRQKSGPLGRLNALSSFFTFLMERGLRRDNPVVVVRKRVSKTSSRSVGPKKYAPTVDETRDILNATRRLLTPRHTAVLMALAKWGRRPMHTMLISAADLVGVLEDDNVVAYADFLNVKTIVERRNLEGLSKLKGPLIAPIDNEYRAFLRDTYLPWRQKEYGLPQDEGPLFPGERHADHLSDSIIQVGILDPSMTYLSKLGTVADQKRWRDHLEPHHKKRISPGCYRAFFTSTLRDFGVNREDRAMLRGDEMGETQDHYLRALTPQEVVARYKMPLLLSP